MAAPCFPLNVMCLFCECSSRRLVYFLITFERVHRYSAMRRVFEVVEFMKVERMAGRVAAPVHREGVHRRWKDASVYREG